jgi:hypothetical protein
MTITRRGSGTRSPWFGTGRHDRPTPPVPVPSTTRAKLRQDRPSSTAKKDDPPSWWVGLDRRELNIVARARQKAMSAAKEAKYVNAGFAGQW